MTQKKEISKIDVVNEIAQLWHPMTEQQKLALLGGISLKFFKKNELIYKDEESPTSMMCLVHGKVKVFKDGVSGRNQIIRVIKPVTFFGYRAYLAGEDYKTAAMALEGSTIAFIPMGTITQLMSQNFNISLFFLNHLSVELGASDDRTVNLTQKHVRGRLAETLLFLKETYGMENDGCTLGICMSREDLANLSNMTTSNAIRTLSSFATEELIALEGRKIRILDEASLRHISMTG